MYSGVYNFRVKMYSGVYKILISLTVKTDFLNIFKDFHISQYVRFEIHKSLLWTM